MLFSCCLQLFNCYAVVFLEGKDINMTPDSRRTSLGNLCDSCDEIQVSKQPITSSENDHIKETNF